MRTPVLSAVFAAFVLCVGTSCGDQGGSGSGASSASVDGPVFGRHAAEKGSGPFTATHILIGARHPRMRDVERSKTQALAAAREVMKKLEAGAKLDDMVANYTDDKGSVGRPGQPDGQYTFGPREMAPPFEQAVRETPIGRVYPDPVETEFGYHIIRRDK